MISSAVFSFPYLCLPKFAWSLNISRYLQHKYTFCSLNVSVCLGLETVFIGFCIGLPQLLPLLLVNLLKQFWNSVETYKEDFLFCEFSSLPSLHLSISSFSLPFPAYIVSFSIPPRLPIFLVMLLVWTLCSLSNSKGFSHHLLLLIPPNCNPVDSELLQSTQPSISEVPT